jgi:hypothetical protein
LARRSSIVSIFSRDSSEFHFLFWLRNWEFQYHTRWTFALDGEFRIHDTGKRWRNLSMF